MRWLVLIFVLGSLAGCSGSLQPGRLSTPAELCAIQGGRYVADVCHTSGGA